MAKRNIEHLILEYFRTCDQGKMELLFALVKGEVRLRRKAAEEKIQGEN